MKMNAGVCRLCLTDVYDQTQSLLDPPYWMMLDVLVPIQVDDSRISTVSCLQCIKNLELFYAFRENVLKSDRILRERIANEEPKFTIKICDEERPQVEQPFNEYASQDDVCQSTYAAETKQCYDMDDCELSQSANEAEDIEKLPEPTPTAATAMQNSIDSESAVIKQCSICLQNVTNDKVKEHIMMHFSTTHTCTDCNQLIGNVKAYQKHIELAHGHVGNTQFKCARCPLRFTYKGFYCEHKKAHELKTTLSKANTKKPACDSGTANMTREEKKLWQKTRMAECSICFVKVSNSNLHHHMKIHTTGPQICELCGAVLCNETSLRSHLRLHSNAPKMNCDECGMEFREPSLLRLHKRKHSNDKNHMCDLCGKMFFTQFHVNDHVRRVHMRIRSHKCTFCVKAFFTHCELKTHLRQHTNDAPYKCDMCADSFRQMSSLRSHRKCKHNMAERTTVACKQCGKQFSGKLALNAHIRVHY